jgi:hypothetical protein
LCPEVTIWVRVKKGREKSKHRDLWCLTALQECGGKVHAKNFFLIVGIAKEG